MVFLVSKSGMSMYKGEKAIYKSAKKYSLFHLICVSSWLSTHLSSPVIYSLFLPEEYEGKKKISALVKMWNRCSNNDWRQLMFSGRSNRLGLCFSFRFFNSKQTWGKCKCEIKVFISQARRKQYSLTTLLCILVMIWQQFRSFQQNR